ncbi:hypothetical protein AURDEDRAFT_159324 [Auricularia subglabra TFB-10046 SS5]|nr:hypothetical protein AURDEDRAFT_159324 [Auricularia subglabra TFB-10046 SS5]
MTDSRIATAALRHATRLVVSNEPLSVPMWLLGEPSFCSFQRWRKQLGVAVNKIEDILCTIALRPGTQCLLTLLCNRYGQQLLFIPEGYCLLREHHNMEPAVACTPLPLLLSSAPSQRIYEVLVPPAPSDWPAQPARHLPQAPASSAMVRKQAHDDNGKPADPGPSSAKRHKKASVLAYLSPSAPTPAGSAHSCVDVGGVPLEPCDWCMKKNTSCVEHPGRIPCRQCMKDHMKCTWSNLLQEACEDLPSALWLPPAQRVHFNSTMGMASLPVGLLSRLPTEPLRMPGPRVEDEVTGEEEAEEEKGTTGPIDWMSVN